MEDNCKDSFSKRRTKISLSRQNSDTTSGTYFSSPEAHRGSILKNANKSFIRKRADSNGGDSKESKVSFKEQLFEIKEVENWKKYNMEEGEPDKSCCGLF